MRAAIRAVLFDLDGTLVDSAPDLAGTANDLRIREGLPALPLAVLRPMVGSGARGMVGKAFGIVPGQDRYDALRAAFLARYEERLLDESAVFDGVDAMLAAIEARSLGWGIVTNKHERYALPVTRGLGLAQRAGALIGGDTTPHPKPHPAPLLEACRRMGVEPAHCVYVGDDLRDVQAGQAAGMRTAIAGWGYLGEGEHPSRWGADVTLAAPTDLLKWLEVA